MDEPPLAAFDLKRQQGIMPCLERLHDKLEISVLYVSQKAGKWKKERLAGT